MQKYLLRVVKNNPSTAAIKFARMECEQDADMDYELLTVRNWILKLRKLILSKLSLLRLAA